MNNITETQLSNISILDTSLDSVSIIAVPLGILLGLAIIIANLITITAIIKVDILWEKYAVLVGSYSAADILVGMMNIQAIVKDIALRDVIVNVTCGWKRILLDNLNLFGPAVSHWHTVIMTIDRFVAIQYPLTYHQKMTSLKVKALIAFAWLIGAAEASLESMWQGADCTLGHRIRTQLITVHLAIIIIINTSLYTRIWVIARKQRHKIIAVCTSGQTTAPQKSKPRFDKATKMVFTAVLLLMALWSPLIILNVIIMLTGHDICIARVITAFIGTANSLVNNVIYFILNKDFQYAYKKILTCTHGQMTKVTIEA